MDKNKTKYKDTLGKRLLISIFAISSAMTIIISAVQLYWGYLQDRVNLDDRVAQVESSYLTTISQSLWDFNEDQLKVGVQGIFNLADIEYVGVTRKEGTVFEMGTREVDLPIFKKIPIKYSQDGDVFEIGALTVIATRARILERLKEKIIVVLISNGIKAYVVSVFILLFVRLLVIRHLREIEWGYFRGEAKQNDKVVFDRKFELFKSFPDIFDSLNDSIYQRKQELNKELEKRESAENKLQNINRHLEAQVELRVEEISKKDAMLLNAEKLSSLGEMAAGVAHEINNPLAIIRGRLELINEALANGKTDPDKLAKMIKSATAACDRIVKIVSGLKFFARDGSQDLEEVVEISFIINETLGFCQERFKGSDVKLHVEASEKSPKIKCQSVQVSQVLLNLLNNAFDAVKGTKDPWVKVIVEEDKEHVHIYVKDSGHGIDKKVAEKIMQPFVTTKKVGEGTGLGLSVSKGIIEEHNGILKLEPEEENTTFHITLPQAS